MGFSAATIATIQTVSAVASVAGTVMSSIGAMNQAKAAKDQANYQAAVARNNKVIADRQAESMLKQGEEAANQQRLKARQLAGRQLVSLAAQGVDVTVGSSVDLLADTAELTAFDAQKIKGNAAQAAYEKRVQGDNFQTQAGLYDAKASAQNPALAGASTLFSGLGSVASNWKSSPGTKIKQPAIGKNSSWTINTPTATI